MNNSPAEMSARPPHSVAPDILSRPVRSGTTDPSISVQQKKDTPNIIIYGEAGVGKSSIINLIAGQQLAPTSNDVLGCTVERKQHIVELNGMSCAIWDTVGLDEGTEGRVPAARAKKNLESLIQDLATTGGIHLLIYCIRATMPAKALQRNYDRFYVRAGRKKVPIALVVTGLERHQGDMETWWAANGMALTQYGMQFDAHACVTTLDDEDHVIQQRRIQSQKNLQELVVRYSVLPGWKIDRSILSSVLAMFRTALCRTMVADRTKKSTTIRRVIVCDMASTSNASTPVKPPSNIPLWGTHKECVLIEGRPYEFVHVDKHALRRYTPQVQHTGSMNVGSGAGVLVFYTSSLGNAVIPPEEVEMLEAFYEVAGGQTCPMIVVLQGCDNEEQATLECQIVLAAHHKDIRAYFTTLSDQQLTEMIARLFIEHVKVKTPTVYGAYAAAKQWLVTAVEAVIPVDYAYSQRGRVGVTPRTGPTSELTAST